MAHYICQFCRGVVLQGLRADVIPNRQECSCKKPAPAVDTMTKAERELFERFKNVESE